MDALSIDHIAQQRDWQPDSRKESEWGPAALTVNCEVADWLTQSSSGAIVQCGQEHLGLET